MCISKCQQVQHRSQVQRKLKEIETINEQNTQKAEGGSLTCKTTNNKRSARHFRKREKDWRQHILGREMNLNYSIWKNGKNGWMWPVCNRMNAKYRDWSQVNKAILRRTWYWNESKKLISQKGHQMDENTDKENFGKRCTRKKPSKLLQTTALSKT